MTILATEIKPIMTADVSKDNPVYNIDPSRLPSDQIFGAISWIIASDSLFESKVKVARYIFALVRQNLLDFKLWFLIGHSALQPDNRITRYRRRRGLMKAEGAEIPHSGASEETYIDYDGGFRYFGAKELSELSIEPVIKAMSKEWCSYLAIFPNSVDMKGIIEHGWLDVTYGFDATLLERVSSVGGLLLKSIGAFDDIEGGFVAVGEHELLKKLYQSHE